MSILSANTLFHFTNKLENLSSILKSGFHPRYCLENMTLFRDLNQQIAIPIVCFCDIPLSLIQKHIEHYKGYGIGLKKEWGVSNKVSPVMYCVQDSQATENLKDSLASLDFYKESSILKNSKVLLAPLVGFKRLSQFIYFTKPVKFYDEREWRFVPKHADEFLIPNKNWNEKTLKEYIEDINKTSPYPQYLKFNVNDVKYVIVNSEPEVIQFANDISKMSNFSVDERNYLITKLLSITDIVSDF